MVASAAPAPHVFCAASHLVFVPALYLIGYVIQQVAALMYLSLVTFASIAPKRVLILEHLPSALLICSRSIDVNLA